MAKEIERKYLVKNLTFKQKAMGIDIQQGYLNTHPARTVRIRLFGDQGLLTIKSRTQGFSRDEYEYTIPATEAKAMLKLCESGLIQKTRYTINHHQHVWEVDEFYGENAGLIIAEIELSVENEAFAIPSWVGQEVTGNKAYYNSMLCQKPFTQW